jgi:hypothetical protein
MIIAYRYLLILIVPIEFMDEDLKKALFDEAEEATFEELNDDFVAEVKFF